MDPKVSIIIPVYNEESILPYCLESLLKLEYPKNLLEIIIIDNNSTDSSASIIKRYPVTYVFEKKPGRSAARNRGLSIATGEIVAFTDADCVVGKHWVSNIVRGFSSPNIGCCAGRTLSYKPTNWIEKSFYAYNNNQYKSKEASIDEYFTDPLYATCNLACRKDLLDRVGAFDESLVAAEDTDIVWRINLLGYQLKHVKNAIVYHKHRDSIGQLPEVFLDYIYWQYRLVKKYKNIINLSFDWFKIVVLIFKNMIMSVVCLPQKKGLNKSVTYFFKFIYSLMGVFAGMRGCVESVLGKNKSHTILPFIPERIIWRWDKNNDVMIIDLEKKNSYHLCGTAARIWELFVSGRNEDEIVDAIMAENDAVLDEVKDDVCCLIEHIKEEGIVPRSVV